MDFKTKATTNSFGKIERPAGVIENPNFRRWFAQSKIVDNQGSPLVVYHGTPDNRFSVFQPDQFFTTSREYAQRFTSSSTASSSFYGVKDISPGVFGVYLRIERPFDTRLPDHRRIYNEMYHGKYGNGAELTDTGLPDWVEARDLVEFLKEQLPHLGFDGLYIDEGQDHAGQRPMALMPFNPNQIKSATTNCGAFDPNDPDITR